MVSFSEHFSEFLQNLVANKYYLSVLIGNIIFLIFQNQIFGKAFNSSNIQLKSIIKGLNFSSIILILFSAINHALIQNPWIYKTLNILVIIFISFVAYNIISYFIIDKIYKDIKKQEQKNVHNIKLLVGLLFSLSNLVIILQILNLESILETTGVLGGLIILVYSTKDTWLNDLTGGYLMFNSSELHTGDIIKFYRNNHLTYVTVYKIKLLHTELLDLSNNHRIMVRNNSLHNLDIENLTLKASTKGIKESCTINISYDFGDKLNKVESYLLEVHEIVKNKFPDEMNADEPPVFLYKNKDYSIEIKLMYYIKNINKKILWINSFYEKSLIELASEKNIGLSTPTLHDITMTSTS